MTYISMMPAPGCAGKVTDRPHSPLSAKLSECIRYLVSCRHEMVEQIVSSHLRLMDLGLTEEEIKILEEDPRAAPLESREAALIDFAVLAQEDPRTIEQHDIDVLHHRGWTDPEITAATKQGSEIVARKLVTDVLERTSIDAGRGRGMNHKTDLDPGKLAFLAILPPFIF